MSDNRKNEHGIALLFTLGLLALLLVMAMAFASIAIMQRRTATNNAELTSARLLAESALQRVLGAMRFYRETGGTQYDDIISHDTTSNNPDITPATANQKTFDWAYMLDTTVDGARIYEWPSPYDPDDSAAIHWQYVDNGKSGADKRLIGRFAYKTFGSGCKLDPAACVRHTSATPGVPAGTAVNENGANEIRNGAYGYEINIQNLDKTNTSGFLPAGDVSNMSTDQAGGLLGDGERWPDWGTYFALLGVGTNAKKQKWRTWFDLDRPADAEAFWIDNSGDGVEEPSELYHRFNIGDRTTAGKTWDDLTVGNIVNSSANYSAEATHEGEGITFLKNYNAAGTTFATEADNTYSSPAAKINQIAANLIDYCDSNRAATTDNQNAPTYTGNDQAPYINEVRIVPDGEVTELAGVYTCSIVLVADVEVVNLYDTTDNKPFNLDAIVTVSGSYQWGPKNEAAPGHLFTDIPITINISGVGDRSYAVGTSSSVDISDAVWAGAPGLGKKINNFNFTKITVKLIDHDTGDFYDFAYVETASPSVDLKSNDSDHDRYYYFDYQVDDPRQNLNENDWTLSTNKKNPNGTLGPAYQPGAGPKNSNCNPNPGGNKDVETGAVQPWDVSTAYIRNSYMRSPWELGFIHRAAKWETLRIYQYYYSATFGVGPADGITTWANGDAGILDQIKMNNATETFGKINVNSPSGDVLKALLGGIRVGVSPNLNSAAAVPLSRLPHSPSAAAIAGGYDDSDPGALSYGLELTYSHATASKAIVTNMAQTGANSIMNTTGTFKPYKSRAQILRNTSSLLTNYNGTYSNELTQTNDALKEEIVGKFINLTKASPDTVTIIVLAQAIKDVGGITINKDIDGDGDVDGNVVESSYDIDGKDSNNDGDYMNDTLPAGCETIATEYGRYDQYADEILAEQKIMATVIYDQTTQKWRILRYEYLE